jgi:hypothetical protein
MERLKKTVFAASLAVLTIGFLAAFTSNFVGVFSKISIGSMSSSNSALLYIEHFRYGHDHAAADASIKVKAGTAQTGKLLDLQNSSGSTVASVATDGDIVGVDGTFSGQLTVNDNLLVDNDAVSDVAVRIDGTSGQAVDILQVRAYDGTEYLDVGSSGAIGLKTATTFSTGDIGLKAYTSDPCGTLGPNKGPWLNTTASPSKMCYCDSSTDDMIVDGSTDCFLGG